MFGSGSRNGSGDDAMSGPSSVHVLVDLGAARPTLRAAAPAASGCLRPALPPGERPELARVGSAGGSDRGLDVRVAESGQLDRADRDSGCEDERAVRQFLDDVPVIGMAADAGQAGAPALIDFYFLRGHQACPR